VSAVARYLLADHFRSRRWVPPFLLLAVGVVVLYAEPPNPVLSTAGGVAAFLLVAQCWLALAFLNTEGTSDRQIVAATAGGRALVLGRLVGLAALTAGTSLLTLAYPVLTGSFERVPDVHELGLILLANLVCAAAGSALAALFAQPAVRSRAVAVLGLIGALVVTVPLGLSPAVATADAMDTTKIARVPDHLGVALVSVAAFVILASGASAVLWRRRE